MHQMYYWFPFQWFLPYLLWFGAANGAFTAFKSDFIQDMSSHNAPLLN